MFESSFKESLNVNKPDRSKEIFNQLLSTQDELEILKWERTDNEIQKIEILNEKQLLSQESTDLRKMYEDALKQMREMEENTRKIQSEISTRSKEQVKLTERERDNLKEMVGKLQVEKQRLTE